VENFADNPDVVFIAVQTVFEGFDVNTASAAKESADEFGLDIPVGHDSGPAKDGSYLMRRYRSRGTPWTVIIDRDGVVRINDFFIHSKKSTGIINQLLAQG